MHLNEIQIAAGAAIAAQDMCSFARERNFKDQAAAPDGSRAKICADANAKLLNDALADCARAARRLLEAAGRYSRMVENAD